MLDSSLILKRKVSPEPSRRINLDIAVSLPVRFVPANQEPKNLHGVAIVDTGASLSLVCKDMLTELGALPHRPINLEGINGEREEAYTYIVDLHFIHDQQMSWTIRGLEVAPLRNSSTLQVLIGMDVITKHVKQLTIVKDDAEIHF
jgi:hypothetical protein